MEEPNARKATPPQAAAPASRQALPAAAMGTNGASTMPPATRPQNVVPQAL